MKVYDNNISIRPLELKYINKNYLNWFKDKDVKKYIVGSNIKNLDELKKYYFENRLNKNSLLLGIFLKKNYHIGNIRVQFKDQSKQSCSIGILIGNKEFRNKGIGKKSLELAIEKINEFYNTIKFELGVNHQNFNAINSYQNAGFIIKNKKKDSLSMEKNLKNLNFHKFSIGTAQMGMNYGILNKNKLVNDDEFKKIINYSSKFGINSLDTSPRYGDVENKIANLKLSGWQISSKFLPANLIYSKKNKYFYLDSFQKTLKNLKTKKIYSVLIHKPSDLLSEKDFIFKALDEIKKTNNVKKIGLSLNTMNDFHLIKKYPFDIIQTPLNFFDQRILQEKKVNFLKKKGIEIQVRSIFLQGLALCKTNTLPKEFRKYKKYWIQRDKYLKRENLTNLELAINFVNQNQLIDKIILGVDNFKQFKFILNTKKKYLKNIKKLQIKNKKIITPFLWKNLNFNEKFN